MNNVANAMHDVILSWALFAGGILLLAIPVWLVVAKPWKPQKHWSQTTAKDWLERMDAEEKPRKHARNS